MGRDLSARGGEVVVGSLLLTRGSGRRRLRGGGGGLGGLGGGGVGGGGGGGGRRGSANVLTRTTVVTAGLKRAGPTTPTPTYPSTWLDRQLLRQFHRRVAAELGDDPDTATGDYDATMRWGLYKCTS
jgi:hypothetical protein